MLRRKKQRKNRTFHYATKGRRRILPSYNAGHETSRDRRQMGKNETEESRDTTLRTAFQRPKACRDRRMGPKVAAHLVEPSPRPKLAKGDVDRRDHPRMDSGQASKARPG